MQIQITLTPIEVEASIKNGTFVAFLENATKATTEVKDIKKKADKRKKKEVIKETPDPVVEAPEVIVETTDKETSPITIDEVRAALAPIVKAGKVAEMQALIKEFGASKITEVKPEDYATLLAKAELV